PRSTPSSPVRRASIALSRQWPPSTPSRARVPRAGRIRSGGRATVEEVAQQLIEPRRQTTGRGGKVRAARLTDLATLSELSRLAPGAGGAAADSPGAATGRMRTLGLPVNAGQISVFTLFRLPLGALLPGDQLYVFEEHGRVSGLARVEHESTR